MYTICPHIYIYIHTYIHMFCFAERLPQTLSDARGSTKGGSGQTGWWPERRIKGASERTKGKNATACRAQPRLLLLRNALSRSRRRGPPLPFRYLQGTDQRDYRRRRSNKLSISRPVRAEATDGASLKQTHHETTRRTSEGQRRKTKRRQRQEIREVPVLST